MAGDWIKMRSNLWDDPRIAGVCDETDASEATVIGGLYWLWASADQHSEDGIMPGLTLRAIDRKTGIAGFGNALVSIGWIEVDTAGVRIVRFEEHNGTTAKKRAVTAKRVANHRGNADVTQEALQDEHDDVTGALAREREREREDIKNIGSNGGGGKAADPHPVDNSASPLAAADLLKKLNGWETERGKVPKALLATDVKLLDLVARKVTASDLRAAYDLAVTARAKSNDLTAVNPGFVCLFIDELRAVAAPRVVPPDEWHRSASGIARKAKELCLPEIPFEPSPATAMRVRAALGQLEHAA